MTTPNPRSLRATAATAVSWTAVAALVTGLAQVAQTMILARLLLPQDFGLGSMMLAVVTMGQLVADVGLGHAMVHRRNWTADQRSTAYWLALITGAAVGALTLVTSHLFVAFFQAPGLAALLQVASVSFLVRPLGQPFAYLLQRDLLFGPLARIESLASAATLLSAVVTAELGWGARSLACGLVGGTTVRAALLMAEGWPRWPIGRRWAPSTIREHLHFGLWRIAASSAALAGNYIDTVLLGRMLGLEALGIYRMAAALAVRPVFWINPIVTRVASPLLAGIRTRPEALRQGYLLILEVLAAVNAPILLGLAVMAPIVVPLVLGPGWEDVVPVARVLSVFALMRSLVNPAGSLLAASWAVRREFAWSAAAVVIASLVMATTAATGNLPAVAVGQAALMTGLVALTPIVLIRPILGACTWRYLRACGRPTALALVMAAVMAGGVGVTAGWPSGIRVTALLVLGAAFYVGASFLGQRSVLRLLRDQARDFVAGLRPGRQRS